MLLDQTVRQFLEALAGADPAPGGGAASALAGALSANLFKMVVAITQTKEDDKREALAPVARRVSEAAAALAALAERDAAAYGRVRHAYGMPQDAEDQRIRRAMEIELAMREATTVPLEVVEQCAVLLEEASEVVRLGRASCIADAGTANLLALSAAMSALLNVQANLVHIDDEAFCTDVTSRAAALATRCQEQFERVRERVVERTES